MKMKGMKEQKWRIYICIIYMKGNMVLCIGLHVLKNKQFIVFVIVLLP